MRATFVKEQKKLIEEEAEARRNEMLARLRAQAKLEDEVSHNC